MHDAPLENTKISYDNLLQIWTRNAKNKNNIKLYIAIYFNDLKNFFGYNKNEELNFSNEKDD